MTDRKVVVNLLKDYAYNLEFKKQNRDQIYANWADKKIKSINEQIQALELKTKYGLILQGMRKRVEKK